MKAIISEIRTCQFVDLNVGDVYRTKAQGTRRFVKTAYNSAVGIEAFRTVVKNISSGEISRAIGKAGECMIDCTDLKSVEIVGNVFIVDDCEAGSDHSADIVAAAREVVRGYKTYQPETFHSLGDVRRPIEKLISLLEPKGGSDEG